MPFTAILDRELEKITNLVIIWYKPKRLSLRRLMLINENEWQMKQQHIILFM